MIQKKPETAVRFTHLIAQALTDAGHNAEETDLSRADALAFLPYDEEIKIKLQAVRRLWKNEHLGGTPDAVIPAILPRKYRTSSKRRVEYRKGKGALSMGYVRKGGAGDGDILESELHTRIYTELRKLLGSRKYEEAAKSLNYCILRGSDTEAALILNVFRVNGDVVRACRSLSDLA